MGLYNELTATLPREFEKPSATRLLFADDNPAVLQQISAMAENQFDIVATLSSGEAVVDQYEALTPDVIVLDISMGRMSGFDVARALREKGCNHPIVFLTVHTGADYVSAALSCGGSAYVLKSRMKSDLVPAIAAALAGDLFVSSSAQ